MGQENLVSALLSFSEIILPNMEWFESQYPAGFGRVDAAPMTAGGFFDFRAFRKILFYQLHSRLNHAVFRRRGDKHFVPGKLSFKREAARRRGVAGMRQRSRKLS